ncbi:MAG: hypothetical protein HC888_00110 [Candidatus Competibacteraceae bacterium]|nr:hypothetical protein [Candidatus Competibacteraceae bacterium]
MALFQLAIGGWQKVNDEGNVVTSYVAPINYEEPGFDLLGELILRADAAGKVFLLLRKRTNSAGTTFIAPTEANLEFSIQDETNGSQVPYDVYANTLPQFNGGTYQPLVIEVDGFTSKGTPIRKVSVFIREITTGEYIVARLVIEHTNDPWGMLSVVSKEHHQRPTNASYVSAGLMRMKGGSAYAVLSPIATFTEVPRGESDFSYPIDQIHYRLNDEVSNEGYIYALTGYSHSSLAQYVAIDAVPRFPRAGVLRVDAAIESFLQSESTAKYVEVTAVGRETGTSHTLRVYFLAASAEVGTSLL